MPSKIFCRPSWPLSAASSRWRLRVGRNSMVGRRRCTTRRSTRSGSPSRRVARSSVAEHAAEHLGAQLAHPLTSLRRRGGGAGRRGYDLLGDREVLLGDGACRRCRRTPWSWPGSCGRAARRWRQAHAAVDGLGGQGVAQLMGSDVPDTSGRRLGVEDRGDAVAAERRRRGSGQRAPRARGRTHRRARAAPGGRGAAGWRSTTRAPAGRGRHRGRRRGWATGWSTARTDTRPLRVVDAAGPRAAGRLGCWTSPCPAPRRDGPPRMARACRSAAGDRGPAGDGSRTVRTAPGR